MRGDFEFMHCYAGGIGTLFSHTFSLEDFSLCCKAWRLSSLEKRSNRTRSRFREVPNLKRRSLGARGARRGLKRKLGPAFSLSGVDLSHLWNLLLYMLVEHCASLFQPQYVDGLLNPSHRTLSFTTNGQTNQFQVVEHTYAQCKDTCVG